VAAPGGGGSTPAAGQSLRAAAPSPNTINSKLDASGVRQPSAAVLVLLLIIIPVLSLSPYWGYHGPSTVSAFMMDEFGISYLDLGLMFSLYSLPNLFMPFIAGSLIDKWGLSLSSLLFNIFCLLGNILLAITFYMPEKPISLLLISRVVFGFGGEAIIMCQQVMLARWFSGTLLVVASGFVQIFVLCLGSGGAFLFLPHFDQDGVNISLLHVLFVSFWGFVFNLFYVALEWKWTPFIIAKFLSERQQSARALEGSLLPLSRPTTPGYETPTPYARSSFVDTRTSAATTTQQSHLVDPSFPAGGHLALAPADSDAGIGSGFFADGHHAAIADNHHIPPVDTHHALFGGGGDGHHVSDNAHLAHHVADFGPFDGHHALNAGGHHLDLHYAADAYSHAPAQPTSRFTPSPAPPQLSSPTPTAGASLAAVGDVEDWGYFRIEGRAQIVTRDGREEWDNITIEGGGRIGRQGGRRVVDAAVEAAPGPIPSLVGGLRNRNRSNNAAPSPVVRPSASASSAAATTAAATNAAADASPAVPFLFYPRVFTSKTVGEDLQSLPLAYWLVACMLFCVAPVLPAFTAFAPLFLQDKFGLGAVASSRAASLVYCVGAGAPFAAFLLAKLRVRSFVQLLTLGGIAAFFLAFYFSGDDGFLPWFFMAGLGLLYCFVLGNGYAWVELTVPRELLGTATALSLAITNAGMALAPFVVGLLRELSSDFDTALLGLLGFVAAGFFFASLVLVVDIAGQGVLIGAQPEMVEAERAELRRLRALKRALLDAEEAKVRQRERDAAEEREIEAELRAEVEREVRRRRAERTQQRLPQPQQPLSLATHAATPSSSTSSSVSPSAVVSSSSSSSSSVSAAGVAPSFSSVRAAERTPLLSPQQRTRVGAASGGEKHV
jgi:MFS family permease